jgi:hypothetical protein
MNQPWSDLPNATHIDWVLASVKENPELWVVARGAAWNAEEAERYAALVINLINEAMEVQL